MRDAETENPAGFPGTEERMRAQYLSLAFRQALKAHAVSPAAGVLLGNALWRVAGHRLIVTWVLVLLVISLFRYLLARAYHAVDVEHQRTRAWEWYFLVSLAVTSTAWGIGVVLLMRHQADAYQALICYFVLGMAGGTSAVYAAHGRSVVVAISLMMIPSLIFLFSVGDTFHVSMAIGGCIVVCGVALGTRLMNVTTRQNVQLTIDLERMARTDSLSGLSNRREFTEFGERTIANANRSARHCAILMIDVDHFKSINDRFGHAGGDEIICALGRVLAGATRSGECAGRIGGEEFALILPDARGDQAHAAASRISGLIRNMNVSLAGQPAQVTVSIGVASTCGFPSTFETLTRRADAALYLAKNQGRNRVVLAEDDQLPV